MDALCVLAFCLEATKKNFEDSKEDDDEEERMDEEQDKDYDEAEQGGWATWFDFLFRVKDFQVERLPRCDPESEAYQTMHVSIPHTSIATAYNMLHISSSS